MVRYALVVTSVLSSLAALPARAAPPESKPFRSQAGGYSVRFPGAPSETADARPDGVKQHVALATNAGRSRSFLVSWADLFIEAAVPPERAVDDAMKGLLKRGGRMVATREVRVSGLPARAFELVQPDGLTVHGRIVVRGDARFYMVMALGKGGLPAAEVEPFFASFSLDGPGIPEYPVDPAPRRVAFPEAGASVVFHGAPVHSAAKEGDARSKVPPMLSAAARGGFRREMAIFVPLAAGSPQDRARALDGFVADFRRESGAISSERSLEVARWPAREFAFTQGGSAGYARAIATDRGMLIVQLIAPPGTIKKDEAAAFLGSVRFESGR
jgi:hypothetical protein